MVILRDDLKVGDRVTITRDFSTSQFKVVPFVPQPLLGDQIAAIAQPIAHTIDSLFGTNIANCGGCKQMQENLNNGMPFAEALKQRLTPKP